MFENPPKWDINLIYFKNWADTSAVGHTLTKNNSLGLITFEDINENVLYFLCTTWYLGLILKSISP